MTQDETDDVTRLLAAWSAGERDAEAQLIPRVYSELRRIAGAHLNRERTDHTLEPTALVHEAFLRLVGQNRVSWRDRAHFFAVASTVMRRILVDYARSFGYAKRGGGLVRVALADVEGPVDQQPQLVLEIDDLLDRLAAVDPTKASIVELRFFGGLTEEEAAEVLGCSARTVTRHWRIAKAWLLKEMSESAESDRYTPGWHGGRSRGAGVAQRFRRLWIRKPVLEHHGHVLQRRLDTEVSPRSAGGFVTESMATVSIIDRVG